MTGFSRALAVLACLVAPAAASEGADPVFGHWLVEDGKAIIELIPCGGEACGRIAWLARPRDAAGRPKTDERNPDPDARARPLCGLMLIEGLERDARGEWSGGHIYSSRDGRSFGLEVMSSAGAPRELWVRGYVGLPILGRSQRWTRVSGDRGGCG